MNQEKFMERLTESKARGAARRAERDTPEKKTQAERDEYNAAIRVHVQTQILDNVHDGKTVFTIMTPPVNNADNIVNAVCRDAGLSIVELDPVVLETEYLAFGMCKTLRVFQITVD